MRPAQSPTHRVPGVLQVEQQTAVLILVVAVGGLCQGKEGSLDALSDALHRLPAQDQARVLLKAEGRARC